MPNFLLGCVREDFTDDIVSSTTDVQFIMTCFWFLMSLLYHANTSTHPLYSFHIPTAFLSYVKIMSKKLWKFLSLVFPLKTVIFYPFFFNVWWFELDDEHRLNHTEMSMKSCKLYTGVSYIPWLLFFGAIYFETHFFNDNFSFVFLLANRTEKVRDKIYKIWVLKKNLQFFKLQSKQSWIEGLYSTSCYSYFLKLFAPYQWVPISQLFEPVILSAQMLPKISASSYH